MCRSALLPALVACLVPLHGARASIFPYEVAALTEPVQVTHAGDERLFIAERDGRVLVHTPDQGVLPTPFMDLSGQVSAEGEGGFQALAFHPQYAANGRVFASYTEPGSLISVLARYEVSPTEPNRVDSATRAELLRLTQPETDNNAGHIAFGPVDAFLYLGLGDGGGAGDPQCLAQTDDVLLGKLLRIDVDQNVDVPPHYGIPIDNPFAAGGDGIPDEIWAKGLRNPRDFSFDPLGGDLFVADPGEDAREEINRQTGSSGGGENYGWAVEQGTLCNDPDPLNATCPAATQSCGDSDYVEPIFEYDQVPAEDCSVVGGFRYRGPSNAARGLYLFGDRCSGRIWALSEGLSGVWARSELLDLEDGALTSIGRGAQGEPYITLGASVQRLVLPICGDVDENGLFDAEDVSALRADLANPGGGSLPPGGASKCTVIGLDRPCDMVDVAVMMRQLGDPSLAPGVQQFCPAAFGS